MTSQPPQPPTGGQPPQPPPGQPGGYGTPPPPGPNPYGQPAGTGVAFDPKRLTMATYALAGLTLLFLVLSLFKWYVLEKDIFGSGFGTSGWSNSDVKVAFFVFLLATLWAALPAVTDLKLGFPRSVITVALAALGFLFTLLAWIDTFDELLDFSFVALLGMLTATAILLVALLSLLPELGNRPALPGALGGAAQWVNRPAAGPAQSGQPHGQPYGQPAQPGQTYGQPGQPGQTYGQPGQPGQAYGWPGTPPQAPPPPPQSPPPPPPAGPTPGV